METAISNLYVSKSLGFEPSLGIRAYLLRRAHAREPFYDSVERDEGKRRIGEIITRLKRGEDG